MNLWSADYFSLFLLGPKLRVPSDIADNECPSSTRFSDETKTCCCNNYQNCCWDRCDVDVPPQECLEMDSAWIFVDDLDYFQAFKFQGPSVLNNKFNNEWIPNDQDFKWRFLDGYIEIGESNF